MEAASLRCEGELIRASFWLHCWLKNQRPFLTCVYLSGKEAEGTQAWPIWFQSAFSAQASAFLPGTMSVWKQVSNLTIFPLFVLPWVSGSKCSSGISSISVGNGLHLPWIYWIWNWWSDLGTCVVTNISSDLRAHQSLRTTKKWCQYSSFCSDKGNLFKALFKAVKTSGRAGSYFSNGLPCNWCFL